MEMAALGRDAELPQDGRDLVLLVLTPRRAPGIWFIKARGRWTHQQYGTPAPTPSS